MRLRLRPYLYYKFFNSLFTGLSVGSVFAIYTPLQPSVFSFGGIALAVGMIIIAKFYDALLNITSYFFIALFVEIVMLLLVLLFLLKPYSYISALLIYSGYQLTFMFGAYLVRAETLVVRKAWALSRVDIFKQVGYLAGMVGSFLFYQIVQGSKQIQVYKLHYLLLVVEIAIIWLLISSFKRER